MSEVWRGLYSWEDQMTNEETLPDFQDRPFTCPYCGREIMVKSPMEKILMGRANCDECDRELLIENDVPRKLPL